MAEQRQTKENQRELEAAQIDYLKAQTRLAKIKAARFLFTAVLIVAVLLLSLINTWLTL